ncbi:radical SAM family heme chaperone HemW [Anditalea andensis]|uniref:Heme chaperone HemW n=1 Tax=Anditalea andensis TaxID=1048983 RepID=A0A074KZP9_9BACT|nr:radical SAM family heme chaperone HemW [Anditalea andensis]KEO73083.1 coproporphyrinogen III oxidase [Anditalea andensis]
MSGIYLHIPFCKQACHYCDFHFSTSTLMVDSVVEMICKELIMRRNYLKGDPVVETIYFGGGTPSLLNLNQIEKILNTIYKNYSLDLKEITIETNPDDLSNEKLAGLNHLGFDRLSIGIQSFHDNVLKFYNRAHNARESLESIAMAREHGFEKLSIDLMYGFPYADHSLWISDLQLALTIDPGHISSYCLTIEPQTALGKWTEKGKYLPTTDDFNADQFEIMQAKMKEAGYIQYEISNFAKPHAFAVHNSNYWKGVSYLGIGPSAHSYDGQSRQHNVANNVKYVKGLMANELISEIDRLEREEIINEYLLTSIRTIWGTDLRLIQDRYQFDLKYKKEKELNLFHKEGLLVLEDEKIILTEKGRILADSIAEKLFV